MRSVEMIVEFPIEDANLPMPHLLGLANAAFVDEVERQGLLLMSPPLGINHQSPLIHFGVAGVVGVHAGNQSPIPFDTLAT